MPGIHTVVRLVGKTLPKFVSPKAHAIADYGTTGLFLLGAAMFWRKNKRAAIASLLCGVAQGSVAALTDYPGGAKHAISFPLHRKIEVGLSSMAATMPEFLAFTGEQEKTFFRTQSILIAAVAVVTDFEERNHGEWERKAS